MRVVLQRVERANVRVFSEKVAGEVVGEIGQGILALVGIEKGDGPAEVEAIADKMGQLRIFEDAVGKTNLDLREVGGAFLVVSQFSLAASLRRGRRPSFDGAAAPADAEPLCARLVELLRLQGHRVETGIFRAAMKVELVNDGPLTFVLECRAGKIL